MTDLCQSIFSCLCFPPPLYQMMSVFKAIFVCVLMKMERGEEELHLFKKKSFVVSMYMNMIFETWLFQQDRIQRDVPQLRGPPD